MYIATINAIFHAYIEKSCCLISITTSTPTTTPVILTINANNSSKLESEKVYKIMIIKVCESDRGLKKVFAKRFTKVLHLNRIIAKELESLYKLELNLSSHIILHSHIFGTKSAWMSLSARTFTCVLGIQIKLQS